MALGAQPAHIGKLIAGQTLAMTGAGVTLSLARALMAGPGIRSLLYGVSARDPKSLVAATILAGAPPGLWASRSIMRTQRASASNYSSTMIFLLGRLISKSRQLATGTLSYLIDYAGGYFLA
jgi:hypothetical protein